MRALKIFGLALAALLALGALLVWHEARKFLDTAPENEGREIVFDVLPGSSLDEVAAGLEKNGIVTDGRRFVWLGRLKGMDGRLKAGRFALNSSWRPEQVLDWLVNGSPVLYRITIPEGLTWRQTGKILADAGFVRFEDFEAVVHDPGFLAHYGIPAASAEGFLMPDTYLMHRPDDLSGETGPRQARAVAGRMADNFWRKSAQLWPDGQKPSGQDLMRIVSLASIVEKETGVPWERARVAGVYANRLKSGMLLQADPTVIYGLGPDFSGRLTRKDLDDPENPYNTYMHPGLPPGPIASFGLECLKAAINPEQHGYIYFVSSPDGNTHIFSRSLADHNRAVRAYRAGKKARGRQ